PNDQGHLSLAAEHVMNFCCVVDDLVHRHQSKIDRHHFCNGPQSTHRCTHGRPDNGTFSDWRVFYPPITELLMQSARNRISSAPHANLFTKNQDALVAVHFFAQCFANGVAVTFLSHSCFSASYSAIRTSAYKSRGSGSGLVSANRTASSSSTSIWLTICFRSASVARPRLSMRCWQRMIGSDPFAASTSAFVR